MISSTGKLHILLVRIVSIQIFNLSDLIKLLQVIYNNFVQTFKIILIYTYV